MTTKTPIFYHPHQSVDYDWISTQKIPEFVRQSERETHLPQPLTEEQIAVAHDPRFVHEVMTGAIPNGFGNTNPEINRSLLASNGSFLAAARHALQTGGVACSATQGFHHANWDHCWGFCTFNGLMIAAVHLLQLADPAKHRHGVERVMIVDGDGHFGDGTEDIIQRTGLREVVYHVTRKDLGAPKRREWNSAMWGAYFRDLIRIFRPGIIMYQAGADAWSEDPFGAGYLTKEGLAARDRGIFTAARNAGIPIVWNLAGGYSDPMQLTIDLHLQTLQISDEVFYAPVP